MPSPRWRRATASLLAASVMAFGGGASTLAHGAVHPRRKLVNVTLQLKSAAQAQFAGYFVALDKGFYRQQGLSVTIRPGADSIVPERVVASGSAQFGVDWLTALLVARENGVAIVNIAQIFQASGMRLVTFRSSHINSIKDFKRHTIGVWKSGNEYAFYALMYKDHLWPPSHYMTISPQPFTMTPFLNHTLDVAHAMSYDGLGIVLESGIKKSQLKIFDYNKLGVSVLEDGIFSTPSYLHSHAGIAAKFLRASIKGWQWAVAHPTLAGQISFRHTPGLPGGEYQQIYMARQVASLIQYGPGLHHSIGYMDPASFHRTWSILLNAHVIDHPPRNAYNQSYWSAAGGH